MVAIDAKPSLQAVVNLLNNATKYSEDAKKIEVAVAARDSHIAIEVADHGMESCVQNSRRFSKSSTGQHTLVHNTKAAG